MGSRFLQLAPPASPPSQPLNPKSAISQSCKSPPPNIRCSATNPGTGGGRPRWDSNAQTTRTGRFKINDENDAGDDSVRFGSGNRGRKWWSDDDGFDAEDDEDDDYFGLWEGSGGNWISKLFRSIGWMVPAVIISMLMGTPNTLIMALALPLGQSAISLFMDKIWEGSGYSQNPRSRAKGDPFPRAAPRNKPRDRTQDRRAEASQQWRDYQSRASTDDDAFKNVGGRRMDFGGWDELDAQGAGSADAFPGKGRVERAADVLPRQQKNGKLSRWRNREKPLFLRLLIAVFPFLGSWTRLFL